MNMWMIWLIAAIIFAVIEIMPPSFFIIWFSVGSLAAAVTSICTDNIGIQFGVFLVLSIVLVLSTKKLTDKFITKKNNYKTNSDKLIGKVGIVTEEIDQSLEMLNILSISRFDARYLLIINIIAVPATNAVI